MTHTWLVPMAAIGRRLFVSLAGIELVISAFLWLGRSDDLTEIARRFLLKFILLSFMLMLLTGAGVWLEPILNSLAFAGRSASIIQIAAGPSEILDQGVTFAFSTLNALTIPPSIFAIPQMIFKMLTQLIIVLCFVAVAARLLMVWIESYVALGAGVMFLGFAGFRATAGYAENYLNYLMYCGAQLFAFYIVGGLGAGIMNEALAIFPSNVAFDMRATSELLAMSVTFALVTISVPRNFASRIGSAGSLGIGQALRHL